MNTQPHNQGFTLVEILVSIAIIGLLSTIAMVSLNNARRTARDTSVLADLSQMRKSVELLALATGKWPSGCPPWESGNLESDLSTTTAGLTTTPTVVDNGDGCEWTSDDIAQWQGPYVDDVVDPWGNPYQFDPDYTPYANCGSETTLDEGVYVLSYGPNGLGLNAYDCDDIFQQLQ